MTTMSDWYGPHTPYPAHSHNERMRLCHPKQCFPPYSTFITVSAKPHCQTAQFTTPLQKDGKNILPNCLLSRNVAWNQQIFKIFGWPKIVFKDNNINHTLIDLRRYRNMNLG